MTKDQIALRQLLHLNKFVIVRGSNFNSHYTDVIIHKDEIRNPYVIRSLFSGVSYAKFYRYNFILADYPYKFRLQSNLVDGIESDTFSVLVIYPDENCFISKENLDYFTDFLKRAP